MAQQVIYEPGYCAFYYPNANCQNKGPGNPYTGDAWLRLNQGGAIAGQPSAGPHREKANASIPDIDAVTASRAPTNPAAVATSAIDRRIADIRPADLHPHARPVPSRNGSPLWLPAAPCATG